jgi:hypothetical protein
MYMKYESPITYHSKDMANVKVFADRQAKNYMPQIFQYEGIKIYQCIKTTQKDRKQETKGPHRSPEAYRLIFRL